jgi:cofilin
MSGVVCADNCAAEFTEMKIRHTKRFITYKIKDKKEIVIDQMGEADKTYDDFLAAMPENEPRYAVCDVPFQTDDGRDQEKIVFFLWNPDDCGVKDKMLYASSKDSIRKKLEGIAKEIQANDRSDLAMSEVREKLLKV